MLGELNNYTPKDDKRLIFVLRAYVCHITNIIYWLKIMTFFVVLNSFLNTFEFLYLFSWCLCTHCFVNVAFVHMRLFISYYKFSLMTDSTCIPNKIICTVACHTCRKYLNTLIYLMCPLKFASCQLVKLRSSIIVFKNKMFIFSVLKNGCYRSYVSL